MDIFIIVVVLAILVFAIKHYLDHKKSNVVDDLSDQAPYKVEPLVEPTSATVVETVAPVVTPEPVKAAPELKVVTGVKKPRTTRSSTPRAKTQPAAKPAKPATPRKPKPTPTATK